MAAWANDLSTLSIETRRFLDADPGLLINGARIAATGGHILDVVDPTSARTVSAIMAGSAADVDLAVAAAKSALHGPWAAVTPGDRERMLWRLADLVEVHAEMLAELESLDVGMPISIARRLNVEGTMAGRPRFPAARSMSDCQLPARNSLASPEKNPLALSAPSFPGMCR